MDSVGTLYSYPQEDRLRRSLEDTIRETNRVSAKWAEDMRNQKTKRFVITNDDIKSVFNGFLKKMLKHYLSDDIVVSRFLSWHKPFIRVDPDTLQIVEINFIPMRDNDHPFANRASKAISEIALTTLNVELPVETKITDVNLISFDSIEKIKF